MKLHAPVFERKLRQAWRAALRDSPEWRKRRRRQATRHLSGTGFWIVIRSLVLCLWLMALAQKDFPLPSRLAVVALWGALVGCARAGVLAGTASTSPHLYALTGLPAAPSLIVRWHWHQFVRQSCQHWPECVIGIASALWAWSQPMGLLLAVLAGTGVWLLATSLATVLGLYATRWVGMLRLAPIAVGALAFVLAKIDQGGGSTLEATLLKATPWLNAALPTGWPGLSLETGWTSGLSWRVLAPLGPAAVLVTIAYWTRKHLLFGLEHIQLLSLEHPAAELEPADPEDETESPASIPETTMADPATAGDTPAFSQHLPQEMPHPGYLEGFFLRRLTAREHIVWNLLTLEAPAWSKEWHRALRVLLGGLLLRLALSFSAPSFQGFSAYYDGAWALVGLLIVLPGWTEQNRGFQVIPTGSLGIPFYALFPVTFQEISRLLLRSQWLRLLAALPFILAYALLLGFCHGFAPMLSLEVGFRAGWLLAALQPVVVVLRFSACGNDTHRATRWSMLLLGAAGAAAVSFLGLGAGFFLASGWISLACGAGLIWPPLLFLYFYRRAHDRARFDLLAAASR